MIDKIINNPQPGKDLVVGLIRRGFLKFPTLKQFIKFSLVGVLNTLIDFFAFFLLTRLIPWFKDNYLVANALAFSLAVTNSFILNKRWTFKNFRRDNLLAQYFKFFILSALTLLITGLFLYYLINQLNIYDLLAKVIVILISVSCNFFISRLFIFRS